MLVEDPGNQQPAFPTPKWCGDGRKTPIQGYFWVVGVQNRMSQHRSFVPPALHGHEGAPLSQLGYPWCLHTSARIICYQPVLCSYGEDPLLHQRGLIKLWFLLLPFSQGLKTLTKLKTKRCSFCPQVVEGSLGLCLQHEYPSGQDAFPQDQVFRSPGDIAWMYPWLRALLPVHSAELRNLLNTTKMFDFGGFFPPPSGQISIFIKFLGY